MTEQQICKQLGVTDYALRILTRAAADPEGRASGRGQGNGSGMARVALEKAGYVTPRHEPNYQAYITDAGRDLVKRARALGW